MKISLITSLLCLAGFAGSAQGLIGRWQLVKQTNCLTENMSTEDEGIQELLDTKDGMSSTTPQVITFSEKGSGEESTRILNKKKNANKKSFLYKFDGRNLYILDKKSQTISDSYTVDELEGDSLILSNSGQPCETKVFVRLK